MYQRFLSAKEFVYLYLIQRFTQHIPFWQGEDLNFLYCNAIVLMGLLPINSTL